jgi:WD40-like Beta Propeller Repeat
MDRGSRLVRSAGVVGLVSLALFAVAAPARAAFPGGNGLLVVEPASGNGVVVVGADGKHPRQICALASACVGTRDPVWSPDGSEIVFDSFQAAKSNLGPPRPYVIYPDGSCLACPVPAPSGNFYLDSWDPHFRPGFLPDGRLAVSIDVNYPPGPELGAVNTDGVGFQPFKVSGSWQQPAWSSAGRLAAVRRVKRGLDVFVVDPFTGSARRLTRSGAASPSWSPDGRRLAVVHRGWIYLIGSGGGRMQRLIRGRAPAWAPNGKQLAFVGAHDRLFVIAARGGRPRSVGHVRAQRVDWQPVTGRPPSACQAPTGSSVVAASPDATVAIDPRPASQNPDSAPAFSVLGCLASDGRERLLEGMPASDYDNALGVGAVVLAGDYSALVNEAVDDHYGGSSDTVAVFDLRSGAAVANRGGESGGCGEDYGCSGGVDQLVLGADAVTAAHSFVTNCVSLSSCTTVEQIVANDATGTRTLDSITTTGPDNPAPASLGQLALSGHTLTWSHAGSPRSAELN